MKNKLDKVTKLIKGYKTHFVDKFQNVIYSKALPENPWHDDLYIVSFPKSGNTWLTFLIANVNLKMSGSDRQVTYYNIHDFIPDLQQARRIRETILPFPGHRIIKSHSYFNPLYNKVLYLLRDPRDIMVSYYWFLKNLGVFTEGLSQLVHSHLYGIEAWCNHVRGWVEETPASVSIDFIRYEDIKASPAKVLTRIYSLLGHTVPDEVLDYAIKASSFENMKRLEKDFNYGGDFRFPGFEFVRKGKSGDYKTEMPEEDIRFVSQKARHWLNIFGYTQE